MKSVLSSKVSDNKFIVLDQLSFENPKTKEMKAVLDNLKVEKALVVTGLDAAYVTESAKNLAKVRSVYSNALNVYDILKYDTVVITKDAVASIEEVYA